MPIFNRSVAHKPQKLSEKALRRVMRRASQLPMDSDPYTRLCYTLLDEQKHLVPERFVAESNSFPWLDSFLSEAHELLIDSIGKHDLEYWYEVYPKLVDREREFTAAIENERSPARQVFKVKLARHRRFTKALETLRSNITPTHFLVEELPGDFLESHLKLSFAEVDHARKLRDDFFYSGKLDSVHAFFKLVRNAAEATDESLEVLEEYLDRVDVALLMLELDG